MNPEENSTDTTVVPVDAGPNTIAFYLAVSVNAGTVSTGTSHLSAIYSPYDGSGNNAIDMVGP